MSAAGSVWGVRGSNGRASTAHTLCQAPRQASRDHGGQGPCQQAPPAACTDDEGPTSCDSRRQLVITPCLLPSAACRRSAQHAGPHLPGHLHAATQPGPWPTVRVLPHAPVSSFAQRNEDAKSGQLGRLHRQAASPGWTLAFNNCPCRCRPIVLWPAPAAATGWTAPLCCAALHLLFSLFFSCFDKPPAARHLVGSG